MEPYRDILQSVGGQGWEGEISNIVTRWTLTLTAKVLPWSPTAKFSRILVHKVEALPDSLVGIRIVGQTDYSV